MSRGVFRPGQPRRCWPGRGRPIGYRRPGRKYISARDSFGVSASSLSCEERLRPAWPRCRRIRIFGWDKGEYRGFVEGYEPRDQEKIARMTFGED